MSSYGIKLTPEDIERREQDIYIYLEALIKGEKLNPEEDYDGIGERNLLKKIALSECGYFKRSQLVYLLLGNNSDDDEK